MEEKMGSNGLMGMSFSFTRKVMKVDDDDDEYITLGFYLTPLYYKLKK